MNIQANMGSPIRFGYLTPETYLSEAWMPGTRPLAAIVYGEVPLSPRPWPQLSVMLRPLAVPGIVEILCTHAPVVYGQEDGFDLAATSDLLFAGIRIEEPPGTSVTALSEQVYARLLRLIHHRDYPYILRMWNTLQDINLDQNGLERYRQFCLGRHEALTKHGDGAEEERYPAASAVGSTAGGLCVYFLAAKSPGIPIENPKQVSAYRYPPQYGPRSPSFARGLVKTWSHGTDLFLSGTASITGHESRHQGRLVAQVGKAIDNLKILIGAAKPASNIGFALGPGSSVLKAYIRHADDYREVRSILEQRLGKTIEIAYLQAEICRKELLFEIEGAVSVPAAVA